MSNQMEILQGAEGLMAAAGTLGRPADEFGNDSRVEALWAMKAMEQAEVYFNVSRWFDRKDRVCKWRYVHNDVHLP